MTVDEFLAEVQSALLHHNLLYRLQIIIHSPKSFKANFHFDAETFLAVRYNARNARTDFALIRDQQRIFGFDNLKEWHCHPFENPSEHVVCDEPTIMEIVSEITSIIELP